MDSIDEVSRARKEIESLWQTILAMTQEIEGLKATLEDVSKHSNQQTDRPTDNSTHYSELSTDNIPTGSIGNEGVPTDNYAFYGLKGSFIEGSIGNEGVPTDRQTDQQTDRQTELTRTFKPEAQYDEVSRLLESLDSIREDVRLKFKQLTPQEMLVFATLYQLDEEGQKVDYSLLAKRLSLTESSIRDYILKITRKGVPILKEKINNKKIILSISPELKKIATLSTILRLRDL